MPEENTTSSSNVFNNVTFGSAGLDGGRTVVEGLMFVDCLTAG